MWYPGDNRGPVNDWHDTGSAGFTRHLTRTNLMKEKESFFG